MQIAGIEIIANPGLPDGTIALADPSRKQQAYAEMYGMGDVLVGLRFTGCYPNPPAALTAKVL